MAILTDADKGKTIAEYFGMSGTREEIQEKLETDERMKQFLEKYIGYDVSSSMDYRDKKGYYPFVIRELMFHEKLDMNNRPIVDLNQLDQKTIGEIIDNPEKIRIDLRKQYADIREDYEYASGEKHYRFIRSFDFNPAVEEGERECFFRFWRVPVSRLLKDRGIDVSTTDGADKATEILKRLYDPRTKSSAITPLLAEWPEHLVEEHDYIEQREKASEQIRIIEEETLKYKPLYETFEKFSRVRFTDKANTNLMAQEAFAEDEAKKELAKLLKTDEDLDEQVFRDTINLMPHQIEHDAKSIKEALIRRNDEEYLTKNPSVPFSKFLADRRKTLPFGEEAKNKALRDALETVIKTGPVDNKAVKNAMNEPCDKLKSDADFIVMDTAKRKSRRRSIIAGISALTALSLFWLGKSAFSSNQKAEKPNKAPTAQKPETPTAKKEAAKQHTAAPAPAIKTPAPAVTPTNTIQEAMNKTATNGVETITTTNAVEDAQKEMEPTVIGKKGNHLIGLHWTGYKEPLYRYEFKGAADLVFKTYFDFMNKEIQETGLPFVDLFKPEYTRKTLKKVHNYMWLRPVDSNKEIRFYIRRDGRTRDELVEDLLSFLMNCRDVLQSLPGTKENLPNIQSKVMTALGPGMGWSTKQQLAWQRLHPEEAKDASIAITELTKDGIQKHKVDTNNVEAVFMETIEAARIYRQSHPENKALLLTVDEVARDLSNIGKEDMTRYDKLDQKEATEAHKQIEELNQEERKQEREERGRKVEEIRKKQAEKTGRPYTPRSSGSKSSGGFPWKTTAAVGIIGYLWGRKKRRGG